MNDKIRRKDIAKEISARHGMNMDESLKVVDTMTNFMRAELAAGHDIEIRGLGALVIKEYAPKTVRNINEKTTMILPARKGVYFRAGKYLKNIFRPA